MINICLIKPEIPQNTGNIARTCAATGSSLHLVHPLGFDISEKAVRHAGLDYWDKLKIYEYENVSSFLEIHSSDRLYFFSQKGENVYSEVEYPQNEDIYLCFGRESVGLDEQILKAHRKSTLRIPMLDSIRSLNLSNCVAIAVYEVLRQKGYKSFKMNGNLNTLSWED